MPETGDVAGPGGPDLSCLALNCTLKATGRSNTQVLIDQVLERLAVHGVRSESIRVVEHDVKPGVTSDEGAGDAWPGIRERILASDIQGLADCGFTVPTNAAVYWVGEAMGTIDYGDLDEVPERVASTTRMMATNLAHVARLLRAHPYPPPS